jgi:hypothetical protein
LLVGVGEACTWGIAAVSRTRILLLAGLIICVGSAALAAVHRDRLRFVGKCWGNGNQLSECTCTFNALQELPENYRSLAVSWAHDNRTAYAVNVMYLIVAEARRAGGNRIKGIWDTSDTKKTIQTWVSGVGKVLRWTASGTDVATVAWNLAAEILPVAYDATAEFLNTQTILASHCGRSQSFIVQINNARVEAEKIASALAIGTLDVAVDAGYRTIHTATTAAQRLCGWLTSWVWN